jgi:hypothetical protein
VGTLGSSRPEVSITKSLVWAIRLKARIADRLGIRVRFQWVPAHVGIPGNEIVDRLAKQATGWREGPRYEQQPAPLWELNAQLNSAANRTEKEIAKTAWQAAWANGSTGQTLRDLLPSINKASLQLYHGLPKALCAVLAQARSGKIALKAYLHAINRAEDNKCACGQVQTVAHILLVCPNFEELRQQVWQDRTSRPTCAKSLLLTPADAIKSARFLMQTGLLGQFARARDRIQW